MSGIRRTAAEHCNTQTRNGPCGRLQGHRRQHISVGVMRRMAEHAKAKYVMGDPEYREQVKARTRERSRQRRTDAAYRARERDQDRRRRYGLPPGEYDALLVAQDGRCGVCMEPFAPDSVPHVDHDHDSGRVRGLLCRRCNRAIGFFGDDPELLAAAWEWVR
jgi:hypothetical protein